MQPAECTFGDGVYMAAGLTTLQWITNKGAPPWKKLILLLPAVITCLHFCCPGVEPPQNSPLHISMSTMWALF